MRNKFITAFKERLNITLTPAGVWTLEKGKKVGIAPYRKQHLSWDRYPDDNMAKHYLKTEQQLIVVDVDGEYIERRDDNTVYIPALDVTIPNTFHTTSTRSDKFHFYLKVPHGTELPSRVTHILDSNVDAFTYGNIFEWHSFAPSHDIHDVPAVDIPSAFVDLLKELDVPVTTTDREITPTSNIQRYNLVKAFLSDSLQTNKQWFAFFKSVFPQEYRPKNKRKLSIEADFPLSYDLFNKIAVKLTSTSELDHYEHTIPTLEKLLTMWGRDPRSETSQRLMYKNVLASLPQHESTFRYSNEEDIQMLSDHVEDQPNTATPVFRVVSGGKVQYLEIDRYSLQPIPHNDTFFLDKGAAQMLHPERDIVNDEGRVVGWDDSVPVVYTINNPYEPPYQIEEKFNRHVVNLYIPTEYLQLVQQRSHLDDSNLVYKALYSTIGPDYLPTYLAYSAQLIFGRVSPTMVLWVAAQETELGGSGKSFTTLELFSLILGTVASAIDTKTVSSGWGDIITSTRLLSLEDMPQLSHKEWELVYSNIKQQNTNSYRKLNMKGAAITSQRVSVAITGSTNFRLALSPSDRRFFCLEPAHFHGITEPLTNDEAAQLAQLMRSHDHSTIVQEYVDYLYYLYNEGLSPEMERALFIEAPQTVYRSKWVSVGETNTSNLIHTLPHPQDLVDLCKVSPNDLSDHLIRLLELVVAAWNPHTRKSAVSWKWFEEMLPYVQADKYKDVMYSKASIAKMLHVDFKNVGAYAKAWRDNPNIDPEWQKWAYEGYTFPVDDEEIGNYQSIIKEMKHEHSRQD